MKTLIMVRHAKSSWANVGQSDFDRPLNERGKKDAHEMAIKLLNNEIKIDAFISSPAKRARKTCKAFMEVYNKPAEEIILVDSLYNAPLSNFYNVVSSLSVAHNHVAIFSHNPGISEFANSLCNLVDIDEMPTCAVFAATAAINNWVDFANAEKTFLFFKYPKQEL